MASTSSAPTAPSANEAASSAYPEMNDMMVDVSRGMNASPVSAAVAAVIGRTPARSSSQDVSLNMHRVLSAPLLSPPANAERTRSREGRVSSGLDQNAHRLPPLRQVCCEMN